MSLSKLLKNLVKQGCFPCISYRGEGTWRAYVNGTGNFWADADTPREALEAARNSWEELGKPMDGYAATEGV